VSLKDLYERMPQALVTMHVNREFPVYPSAVSMISCLLISLYLVTAMVSQHIESLTWSSKTWVIMVRCTMMSISVNAYQASKFSTSKCQEFKLSFDRATTVSPKV
jgi:hypothetical protein